MGCNTSKETIPTTEEKDNVANNEGIKKVEENGDQTQIQGKMSLKQVINRRKNNLLFLFLLCKVDFSFLFNY